MQVQSADLILEQKLRGHLPVTRFSVSESGAVMAAVPDQHQPRLYRLGRLLLSGEWEEIATFSVETLACWDFCESGQCFVAATDDDVYVFRGETKIRLFPDRRDVYADVSICATGEYLVVGSADMLLSGYSVTLGRTTGEVLWTKDLPFSVTRSRISPDGSLILVGSEEGTVVMLDSRRNVVWRFECSGAVSALALSNSSDSVVIGTREGAVMAAGSGDRLWEIAGEGPVVDCALAGDGTMIAVARSRDTGGGRLECVTNDGDAVLEHATPTEIASVACSRDGRFVAISCKDGTLQALEITAPSPRLRGTERAKGLYEEACRIVDQGQYSEALHKLQTVLELSPDHVSACRKLIEIGGVYVEEAIRRAEDLGAQGEFADAVRELQAVQAAGGYTSALSEKLARARGQLAQRLLARANELSAAGQIEEAVALIGILLGFDFTNIQAREELARLQDALAARYLADAGQALDADRPSEAVQLLEKAQDLKASEEVLGRLADARCKHAFATGLALYGAKKYSEAAFQFRKVLSIDPQNAEAGKYVEYCESLREDEIRFGRFSKLE